MEQVFYAILEQARIRLVQVHQLTQQGQLLLLILPDIPENTRLSVLKNKV